MKKIIIFLLCFIFTISLEGCNRRKEKKEYANDSFRVFIKTSYKNEFINKSLDFEYKNIESYYYASMVFEDKTYYGYLMIYLKKTGEKEIKKAMEYFESQDFVDHCDRIEIVRLTDPI